MLERMRFSWRVGRGCTRILNSPVGFSFAWRWRVDGCEANQLSGFLV